MRVSTGRCCWRCSWCMAPGCSRSTDGLPPGCAACGRRPTSTLLPHVVVVGGGFGGIEAVRGLRRAACRITLIDQRNHHLFQPLLYQVATAGLSPGDIATPVRAMVRDQANVRVLLGEVIGVDVPGGQVLLQRGAVAYDYLVLATGARHSYFGRDDWAPYAPGLKTIEDSTGDPAAPAAGLRGGGECRDRGGAGGLADLCHRRRRADGRGTRAGRSPSWRGMG